MIMLRFAGARYLYAAIVLTLLIVTLGLTTEIFHKIGDRVHRIIPVPEAQPTEKPEPSIVYKKLPEETPPPIKDNFPLAAKAKSASDIPPIPSYNAPPKQHVPEKTPVLIGFTRNWLLLQQTVVGYITAGWPPSDIYVIDNTGTMNSNELGKLTLQNPFYLDHNRLTNVFGVNVIRTPTLFSFSQLQNFYMHLAIENDWKQYFWGHMDVAPLSEEDWRDPDTKEYKSLYMRAVDVLRNSRASDKPWAIRFCAYDYLALVNLKAFMAVGGWDTHIPFYMTDCDMHERLAMHGFQNSDAKVGFVYDVGSTHEDLIGFFRRKPVKEGDSAAWGEEDELGLNGFKAFRDSTWKLADDKHRKGGGGRNSWQTMQHGGKGEPFYVDPAGFEETFLKTIDFGRDMFKVKWGFPDCGLRGVGLEEKDAYLVDEVVT